ncbi:MAG: ABC transporter ATP-binding protein [Leptolyngbya sp. SIO1D8]|nr:ABC transporter ATP-binding protein [Leptolyngbya sp. SIO1D8]
MLIAVETQLFTDQVWEEVVFGLENWNLPPGEIQSLTQAAVTDFDLIDQQDWPIRQLSAGQKQRLLLACLLTRHPDILLLDEPFAFLDSAGVHLLLQLLQNRVQQGQAVLLIEHRLELLQETDSNIPALKSDRAYRMDNGCVTPIDPSDLQALAPATKNVQSPTYPPSTSASALDLTSDIPIVLQTQQLSWGGYPPFPDLKILAGDIILLRGENGCGKTTLLKLLSGLLKPSTGQLMILGQDTARQNPVQMSQTVGFVLQNPNHQLFAESVKAEIMQPGVAPAKAQQLLEKLNLNARADQHPQALSQGQKRRLALGAVIARQPHICLLDEIMVGQDATSLALMLGVLKTFTAKGGTLIFTSHNPGVANVLQPRIIPLSKRALPA